LSRWSNTCFSPTKGCSKNQSTAFPRLLRPSPSAGRDSKGRSLRDFDLEKRLFRYPLSNMIYSPAFDAMPDDARSRVYRRLFEVLSGKDQSPAYARLSPEGRQAALEIVRETKKGLPGYWGEPAGH
jgi:hypothetical protein